jgi:predicted DCC family thiol-disulfide oxidoreductase YuxK
VAHRPTLVYDADCGFCTRSAQLARRWVDRGGRYDVLPWQELDLDALGLTAERCDEAAQFVTADGGIRSGHEAIAAALTHGAPGLRPLGHVLLAPGIRTVAARTYAWVAQHRHQLPGGTAACARSGTDDDPTVGDAPHTPGLRQGVGPI